MNPAQLLRRAAALAAAALLAACATAPAAPEAPPAPVPAIPIGDAPTVGPADAPVTIVEFADFQCPYCAKVQPTLKEVLSLYPGQVRHVFKNNPLAFHKDARQAAVAALAAGHQGKWTEMKAALFANSRSLGADALVRQAESLGLDMARFRTDVSDPVLAAQVDADMALAAKLGATATPAFFINGRKLSGAQPLEAFTKAIDAELERAAAMAGYGLPAIRVSEALTWLALEGASAGPAAPRTDDGNGAAPTPTDPKRLADGQALAVRWTQEHARRGGSDPLVTWVVFLDYQCPFCGRLDQTMEDMLRAFDGKLRVVVRHLPLGFHKNAHLAAEAAQAAGEQGRYWDYHARLMSNQRALTRADLVRYARDIGLDSVRFEAALDDGRYAALVDADAREAETLAIRGTPTSVLNGRVLVGAKPPDQVRAVIERELARAQGIVEREGLRGEALYERLLLPE